MTRRWRRVSPTEIGTGPWRGPAGAVSLDAGMFHAEVWGAGKDHGKYLGAFADEAAAKLTVERWLARRGGRP